MAVKYPIESLGSRLEISAISALHGQLITDALSWDIAPLDKQKPSINSSDAQPSLELHPGKYKIELIWQQQGSIDAGEITLQQGFCHDVVVLVHEAGTPDREEGYFVSDDEVNKHSEYNRRQQERDSQRVFGVAAGPLADPTIKKAEGAGQSIASHPLLSQSAQFDGVAPEISNEPTINEEATEKTKELILQNQLQAQLQNNPNITPSAGPM